MSALNVMKKRIVEGCGGAVRWLISLREEMEGVWDGPFPQTSAFLEKEIPCH